MIVLAVVYVVVWLATAVYLARRSDVHKDTDSDIEIGATSLMAAALWPFALVLRVVARGIALFGKLTRRPQADAPPDPRLRACELLLEFQQSGSIDGLSPDYNLLAAATEAARSAIAKGAS